MVFGGERSSVGVVYMGREGVDRTWYDTLMYWLKGKNQELQQRGCRTILRGGGGGGGGGETLTNT